MKGRKVLIVVVLFSLLLGVPLALTFGFLNLRDFPIFGELFEPSSSSSTAVFVEPSKVIDSSLQVGSRFTVDVNVSDVVDLFTWHVKVNWDKAVLNVSGITYGDFLGRTLSPNRTSSNLGIVSGVFNEAGYAWVSESVLGDYSFGVSGSGRLASFEFVVVGYGRSHLNVTLTGPFETTFVNGAGVHLAFSRGNGFFSNRLAGDVNGDRDVDAFDLFDLGKAYNSVIGGPGWDSDCDFNWDGRVDGSDLSGLSLNYGKAI